MASSGLSLSISVADNPHVAALLSGEVGFEGVDARFIRVDPQVAAFRRMVRGLEFDVCELAPTTYMVARAYGLPVTALPIFVMRSFHHGGLLVRPQAGIRAPKDLEGKKVGVRAYTVTTGVWARGMLAEEYGLDCAKVDWWVDDEEHVQQLPLPANVRHVAPDESLAGMMRAGEIDAGFAGAAGIGRVGPPLPGWEGKPQASADSYPELFENPRALETEWFNRTKIYPIHGTIVVKNSVLERHPFVARSLFDGFCKAKAIWLEKLRSGEARSAKDVKYRDLAGIVGADPLPYGMGWNSPSIEALARYCLAQGLTPASEPLEALFVDPEKR